MPVNAPQQQRTADPYSEQRYSSVINRFTRMVTGGKNVILQADQSFIITIDDWKTITVKPGLFVKDDALIHMTDDYTIDFTDELMYVDAAGVMTISDYYYIVAEYTYSRSLPAPKSYYRIIRDENIFLNFQTSYLYLGNIFVKWNDGLSRFEIDLTKSVYYQHPTTATGVRSVQEDAVLSVDGGLL